MSTNTKILSDLQKNSASKLMCLQSSVQIAAYGMDKVAYEKSTAAMYEDIKYSLSNSLRVAENMACTKRIATSLEINDHDELYSSLLMYQEITGSINTEFSNGKISGNAILSNPSTYLSWYRRRVGVEAKVKILREDIDDYSYNQKYAQDCFSQEQNTPVEIPFEFNLKEIVSNMEKEEIKNGQNPTSSAYTANIDIIPFVIITEQQLYLYDKAVHLSYKYNDGKYTENA